VHHVMRHLPKSLKFGTNDTSGLGFISERTLAGRKTQGIQLWKTSKSSSGRSIASEVGWHVGLKQA
jgi:hypothetical protein